MRRDYLGKNLRNAWDEAGQAGLKQNKTVLFRECQIQLVRLTFLCRGNSVMLCWSWKKTDFMFIAVFWGCGLKYSQRCLPDNSKRKQLKKFLFRERNQLKSREKLLLIYPTSAKPIDESNYAFLLDLAKEYMMAKITEKCESYFVGRLGSAESCTGACVCGNLRKYVKKGNCLWLLVIAQTYGLDRLETACIERTKRIKFTEFKKDNTFDKISAANYRKIVEGMLQ